MNKNERLIQQMIYINAKKQFNLSDFIETFEISRSTALRDIASLEELGVPLYSEKGSHGGYRVLSNSLLPPIYFNTNELHSIFFSLQLLKGLVKTPFQYDYQEIKSKLLATLPDKQKEQMTEAEQWIQWVGVDQQQEVPLIVELFASIIARQVIEVDYHRYQQDIRVIQPLRLSIWDGHWYCLSWDLNKQAFRNFRCDYIQKLHITEKQAIDWTAEQIHTLATEQFNVQRPLTFKVKVNAIGIEHFHKKSYSNMSLQQVHSENDLEPTDHYIVGTFGESEISFLVEYFLGFGQHIEILSPPLLRTSYQQYVQNILAQYE